MADLLREAESLFASALLAVERGESLCAANMWGTSPELLASVLRRKFPKLRILCILSGVSEAERFHEDLPFFAGEEPDLFPGFDSPPVGMEDLSLDVLGSRVEVIGRMHSGSGGITVTSVQALVQPTPDKETLRTSHLKIRTGDFHPPEDLVKWLIAAGFRREKMVERVGEFAVRGGIVDVFPLLSDHPVRIEFFGDDIESIRTFDPMTQRSAAEVSDAMIRGLETRKLRRDWQEPGSATLLDHLPVDTIAFVVEPGAVFESARSYHGHHGRGFPGILPMESLRSCVEAIQRVEIEKLALSEGPLPVIDFGIRSLKRFEVDIDAAMATLRDLTVSRRRVVVVCHNQAEKERLDQLAGASESGGKVESVVGLLSGGFDAPAVGLLVASDTEVFNRFRTRRSRGAKFKGAPITDLVQVKVGDFVVHLAHGIAKYEGLQTITKEGRKAEYMRMLFADNVRLFVPLHNIDLVQKYIGAKGEPPALSMIGGVAWENRKKAIEESIKDLAQELLDSSARRMSMDGIAHPTDTDWQRKFEASFQYQETEDQIRSLSEIKKDMERPRPMERLLCGDVGFGKTELVIRAAFKTVMGGRQVAVLVPTTVLAEQHYRTFRERMAAYPVTVEVISRFRTKGEQSAIIQRLREGSLDVVIGTHRLLSEDMAFEDLGLVVIDEEHKFGVEDKERLKKLKMNVDVLSLSATPIPRTLHMALTGIRDVSNLYTPPAERLPIITRVARFDKDIVRRSVIRELDRNGQIFFLHNRVESIYRVASMLEKYVPEVRMGVGHGQMGERELEDVMLKFLDRQIDMLVCTTIIESGIDIPNANTMIINEADHFGLATLHQLRGRIGRYKHQGYCYLLIPGNRTLSATGTERLKAIEEFSELGSGFQLAMRDLEIRGSGNILGREQHGHINAIGYELYCKLIEKAVRELRGEKEVEEPEVTLDLDIDTYFPADFPLDDNDRIQLYRRLIRCNNERKLQELRSELDDRFGPLPRTVANLFETQRLKVLAGARGVYRISLEENGISLRFKRFNLKSVEALLGPYAHLVAGMLDDGIILGISGRTDSPEKKVETLRKILTTVPATVA